MSSVLDREAVRGEAAPSRSSLKRSTLLLKGALPDPGRYGAHGRCRAVVGLEALNGLLGDPLHRAVITVGEVGDVVEGELSDVVAPAL